MGSDSPPLTHHCMLKAYPLTFCEYRLRLVMSTRFVFYSLMAALPPEPRSTFFSHSKRVVLLSHSEAASKSNRLTEIGHSSLHDPRLASRRPAMRGFMPFSSQHQRCCLGEWHLPARDERPGAQAWPGGTDHGDSELQVSLIHSTSLA